MQFKNNDSLTNLKSLLLPGEVYEVRIPKYKGKNTCSGYFDDPDKMFQAIQAYGGKAEGIYFTLNPCNPVLLSRASNRIIEYAKSIKIDVSTLSQRLYKNIIDHLTIENPNYRKAIKLGRYTGNIERFIRLYRVENNILILPRGYIRRLIPLMDQYGQEYEAQNHTVTLSSVNFGSKIVPRTYQEPAIEAIVQGIQGGIVGGCGSGKTIIMLEGMARIGQPALWITHTNDLVEQVIKDTCQSFDIKREEIGVIANGKVKLGDRLTVALVQTLSRIAMANIADKFGAVFIDEGHHMAANKFCKVIERIPARYRIWCSATPERQDGLSELIFLTGGDIIYTIDSEDLPTLIPQFVIVETSYKGYVNPDDYSGMIKDLVNNHDRNQLIVDVIAAEAPKHYSLVLSERVEHLHILKAMLDKQLPNLRTEILTGTGMTIKERNYVMEQAKAKNVDILLATQVAREGLDIPHLDRLFLVSPKKNPNAIIQEIGRIQRPYDGKLDAIVFDFRDIEHGIFDNQFRKRKFVYQEIGNLKNCYISQNAS